MRRFAALGLFSLLALGAMLAPNAQPAHATGVTHYDIHDWVLAQGSNDDMNGNGIYEPWWQREGGDLWVPPINNYIGWTAPATNRLASVDYAGVAARYLSANCGTDLGTTHNGSVTARDVGDGTVLVSVHLQTKNALSWGIVATDLNGDGVIDWQDWDFYLQPVYFGARPAEVCDGVTAALANVEMDVEYYVNAGDPVLVDIGTFDYATRTMMLRASATGDLADGTPARMTITQTGVFMPHSQAPTYDGFPAEKILFQPIGR